MTGEADGRWCWRRNCLFLRENHLKHLFDSVSGTAPPVPAPHNASQQHVREADIVVFAARFIFCVDVVDPVL